MSEEEKEEFELEEEKEEQEAQPEKEEIEVEEVKAEEEPKPEEEPKKGKSNFQKRINDLTHKQREAERQRDEYYKVAQQVMDENNRLRQTAKGFSSHSANEMENRIKYEIESAKSDYKKAYEEGDADKIVEAQEKMVKAASQTSDLERVKEAANPKNYEAKEIPITPPPDMRAVEWANRNSWFNKDTVMTNAAYAIHDELIKKGVSAESDNYYEMIDSRMREEFPHKFEGKSTPKRKETVDTVVTPGGNQSGKSRKVRLTPSQVAVANRLGVPLQEYAKQFAALERN